MKGFDFRRDPLNAKKPMMTFEEIMKEDIAAKPKVMAPQRKLLESRYDLEPRSPRQGEDVARQAGPASARRPGWPRGRPGTSWRR